MSAAETTKIIKVYFDAVNSGDKDAVLPLLHEDIAHDINQADRQIGIEKYRWYRAEQMQNFDQSLNDIIVMADEGGVHAAAEFTVRGSYIKSVEGLPPAKGQNFDYPAGIFFEVDDGLISRISNHFNQGAFIDQLT